MLRHIQKLTEISVGTGLSKRRYSLSDTNTPEAIAADEKVTVTFKALGLDPKIIKALDDLGYETPTPIQAHAIPAALNQRDVLGIAATGTGKTGAFTLPTMHKLAQGRARARMPRCLIICPTRELAAQVAEDVENYGKYLKMEMALLIGGVSFSEQDKKLSKGVDILIATPGRLLDQFKRGKILMTGVQTLIVDEADRMLDMGFIPDIEEIFKMTPFTRQVLFFSATMPNEIKRLVDQFLHQPLTVQIARTNMTAKTVSQRIVRMPSSDAKQKRTVIRWLIEHEDIDRGIIFCNRKRDVDIVAKSLNVHDHDAAPIHGDLSQSLRTQTLDRFRNGEIKFLVASDVAARGLDVPTVSHVFNYDVPNHSEDYVHRIGRTGRAGRKGDAITLVARLDAENYTDILNLIQMEEIPEIEIPGIEDFPKDAGGRRASRGRTAGGRNGGGRDGGRSRRPSRDGRKDATRRVDGSYHDGQASTEQVKSKKAPTRKAAPSKKPAEKVTTEKAAPAKAPAKAPARAPAKTPAKTETTSKSTPDKSASRRRKAPGRAKPKAGEPAKEEAPQATSEEVVAKTSSDGRRRKAPARKKPLPETVAKAKLGAKSGAKSETKSEAKSAPKSERQKSERKPEGQKPKHSNRDRNSDNQNSDHKKSGRNRAQNKPHNKPTKGKGANKSQSGKTSFGDDIPDFLK